MMAHRHCPHCNNSCGLISPSPPGPDVGCELVHGTYKQGLKIRICTEKLKSAADMPPFWSSLQLLWSCSIRHHWNISYLSGSVNSSRQHTCLELNALSLYILLQSSWLFSTPDTHWQWQRTASPRPAAPSSNQGALTMLTAKNVSFKCIFNSRCLFLTKWTCPKNVKIWGQKMIDV
jgi:hypothetical protein